MKLDGYRGAACALLALFAAFWAPTLLRGRVIYPHDNTVELAAPPPAQVSYLNNRRFSDVSSCYVPELEHQLNGDSSGWIPTWNPHVGLGRPAPHTFGFTKAFLLTHALSLLTSNPYQVYTITTVTHVVLAGLFAFLFLRALKLHPWACFAGAALLASGVFISYWLSFQMYIATLTWGLCILWLSTRWFERPSFPLFLGVSLACYCALMTSYPQQLVHHAFLLVPYVLIRAFASKAPWRNLLLLSFAALSGALATWPVFADLLENAALSNRWQLDRSFFVEGPVRMCGLPRIESWNDLTLYLSQCFDPFWFGNPVRAEYPHDFGGFSLAPLGSLLVLWALLDGGWRRLWPWFLFILVFAALTLSRGAYGFAVDHLRFDISRFTPIRSALIPFMVVGAFAADRVLRREVRWLPYAVAALIPLALMFFVHISRGSDLVRAEIFIALGIIAGALAFVRWRRPVILVSLVVASAFAYGGALVLARPEDAICRDSQLVQAIRSQTASGTRYALINVYTLPSNQESLLGIRSVHTYDTLATANYQDLVARLTPGGMTNYGRHFQMISSPAVLGKPELSYTGVGVLVSTQDLGAGAQALGSVGAFRLYVPDRPPLLQAQVALAQDPGEAKVSLHGSLSDSMVAGVARTLDRGDLLRFRTPSRPESTLLFVSQQFHSRWRASSEGKSLRTVLVNDFYQGVVLPAGTESVELRFVPRVLWSWVPQAGYAALGLLALGSGVRRRLKT